MAGSEWVVIYERETARVVADEEAARAEQMRANKVAPDIEVMAFSVAHVAEVMGARS